MTAPVLKRLAAALSLLILVSCSPSRTEPQSANGGPSVLRVAAASDLQFALQDVNAAFVKTHPRITIEPQFGSSGSFASQIDEGAPFDVFLSADVAYAQRLVDKGLAFKDSLKIYGIGRIVVWVSNDSTLDIGSKGLAALAGPGVKKVAIANPEHAPYGRAAVAALRNLGLYDAVLPKLVLGENVTQAAQFVQSGSADAGIVALSVAESPRMKSSGRYQEIPIDAYPRLEQAGVALTSAGDPESARAYVAFLAGSDARTILARYGFSAP